MNRETNLKVPFGNLIEQGYLGVAFFFVLSGFILTWVSAPGEPRWIRDFYVRRFSKVYPLHVSTLAFALVVPKIAYPQSATSLLYNVSLLQSWSSDLQVIFGLNAVSWSLSCELFFYALTPVLIKILIDRPHLVRLLIVYGAVGVLSLAAMIFNLVGGPAVVTYVNPAFRLADFLFGVGVALVLKQITQTRQNLSLPGLPTVALAGLVFWFVVVQTLGMSWSASDSLMVPAFGFLIFSFALQDLSGKRSILHWVPLVKLGEWSFAFYLVHELVILNLARFVPSDVQASGKILWFLIFFSVSLALAAALHYVIEKPAQKLLLKALIKPISKGVRA